MKKIFTLLFILGSFVSFSQVRISQVYGAGGNASATYTADYVELFNAGTSPASLSGYSIQYASATGTAWQKFDLPATSLAAGQYFLIQMSTAGATGVALPAPDATASPAIAMSGTAGKVALVNATVALSGTQCPPPFVASIVDYVGFGATANCFEGTGPTPIPGTNANSLTRLANGCTDNNDNAADFVAVVASARNTSSAFNPCGAPSPALVAGPNITNLTGSFGVASAPQTFTLSGFNLVGFPDNVAVTASANLEVSLSSGSGYGTTLNVPFTSATLTGTTIYVRIAATAPQGAITGTVSCAVTGGTPNATVTVNGGVYQNYYNTKANNGLNNVSTWSSTLAGSGSSPADFTTAFQLFNIVSQANANYTGVWDVTSAGNSSKVVVGDGVAAINFTVGAGIDSVTSATRIDILNNSTLTLLNNRRPFLNNIATGSTINFAQTGLTTSDTIKVPALSYYNLSLSNGIKILSSGTTTVRGNLTVNDVINFNGAPTPFSTVNAFGDVSFTGSSTFEPLPTGDNARLTLAMNGSGTQTITGTDVLLFRLQRDTTSSNSIIQLNVDNLVLGNASGGGLRLNQGVSTTTVLNATNVGATMSIIGGAVVTPASNGKINSTGLDLTIAKTVGTSNAGTLRFTSGSILVGLSVNFGPAFVRDSITIADSVKVEYLTLNKGKVVVSTGAVLDVTDGPLLTQGHIIGGSATSFVDGKLRRSAIIGAPDANFPVGKGNKYAPVDIENAVFAGGATIQYFFAGYGNYTIDPATQATYPAYEVSTKEYWVVENTSGFALDLTFHYTDALSGIIDPTQVKIAHFDGADWNDLGGTDGVTNTTTNGTVTVTGVSTFSPFTFSARVAGVIPVKLASFDVQKLSSSVKLSWSTVQEINSREFIIERSSDGRTWSSIGSTAAAGTSNVRLYYNFIDVAPAKGLNFYRIRQVDLDGRNDYSVTRTVLFNSASQILISPNPATDFVNVYLEKISNGSVTVQLLDLSGRVIKQINSDQPQVRITTVGLASGMYFVKVIDGTSVTSSKVMIK